MVKYRVAMFLYRGRGNNFVSKMSASSDVCSAFLEVSSREKIKANVPEKILIIPIFFLFTRR